MQGDLGEAAKRCTEFLDLVDSCSPSPEMKVGDSIGLPRRMRLTPENEELEFQANPTSSIAQSSEQHNMNNYINKLVASNAIEPLSNAFPATNASSTSNSTNNNNAASTLAGHAALAEQEVSECSICLERWTLTGSHRIVSITCGHLFGKSCIEKWLKMSSQCPQCKSSGIKKKDIRALYATRIRVFDQGEKEKYERELFQERKEKSFHIKEKELLSLQCERLQKSGEATRAENCELKRVLQSMRSVVTEMMDMEGIGNDEGLKKRSLEIDSCHDRDGTLLDSDSVDDVKKRRLEEIYARFLSLHSSSVAADSPRLNSTVPSPSFSKYNATLPMTPTRRNPDSAIEKSPELARAKINTNGKINFSAELENKPPSPQSMYRWGKTKTDTQQQIGMTKGIGMNNNKGLAGWSPRNQQNASKLLSSPLPVSLSIAPLRTLPSLSSSTSSANSTNAISPLIKSKLDTQSTG